MQQSNFVTV